jgi:ABC-type transport system involved in cytochrome c biogenesis permease subunit
VRLREWLLSPNEAPAWLPLLVLAPIAAVAIVVVSAVSAPWWVVAMVLGGAGGLWQLVAERLRARERPQAD